VAASLVCDRARVADAAAIAAVRVRASMDLTARFGPGHWSSIATQRGVVQALQAGEHLSRVLVAREGGRALGTLRIATRKPWAIDRSCFVDVPRAIYLTDMAVDPAVQRRGIGRALLAEAEAEVRRWPGQAIRLDAYAAPAGAGDFYRRCGFREVGRVVYRRVRLVYFELLL
jgi:ribosomal protein S18 acetylase RimI-like enzyme